MLNKFREWVISNWFEREYKFFKYPFTELDYRISKLSKSDYDAYLSDIKKYYKSNAFEMEQTELKKLFYRELACKTSNDIERSAYRLCLLYIRKVEQRYKYLTDRFYAEEKIKTFKNKI